METYMDIYNEEREAETKRLHALGFGHSFCDECGGIMWKAPGARTACCLLCGRTEEGHQIPRFAVLQNFIDSVVTRN